MSETENKDIYNKYLNFANNLADIGGEMLRRSFKTPINVNIKYDLSPVTQIDIEVEMRIRTLIEDNYPTHGIIGEEFGNIRENSVYQWVIDPIDGTKSFISGYPIFTILIALLYEGKPILSTISQPILYERWGAIIGQKTLYNNSPLPILNNNHTLAQANITTTSIDHFTTQQAEKFLKLRAATSNTIIGGDSYAYAMLTEGRLDIVLDADMKPYDFSALTPIIEGVGGVITDWSGNPLTLLSDGTVLATASKELHKQALSFLNT